MKSSLNYIFAFFLLVLPHISKSQVYVSGNLSLTTELYGVEGINPRKPGFAYAVAGSPTLHIGEFSLPFGFIFSNYQRDFRQPFNQLGISPEYKGIKFHLGHRSLSWSKYSLGGHRFFGAGAETQLGIFRLGYVRGRFLNAIEADTSISNNILSFRPSFNRNGWAAKIGFGKENTHIDFVYFKAEDDITSIDSTAISSELKPTKNAVLGINGRLKLHNNFFISSDFGLSGLTRDTRAQEIDADSTQLNQLAARLLTPQISTQVIMAGEASINYKAKNFGADLQYLRIDPGYISHGTYYMRTDIARWSVGSFVNINKGMIQLSGRLGKESDNVKAQKTKTTTRSVFSSNLNFRPHRALSINAQYANFGVSQEGLQVNISDTTRLNNLSKNIVISPNINFQTNQLNHNISAVYSNQIFDDKNRFTSIYTSVGAKTLNLNYTIGISSFGLTANVGWNNTIAELPVGTTLSKGLILGLGKSFLKQKVFVNVSYNRNSNEFQELNNGSTSRWNGTLRWKPAKSHQISVLFYRLTNNTLVSAIAPTFTETNLRTTYSYRFNTKKTKK